MAAVMAPFDLPAAALDPNYGAGGAPTDPRAPGVEIEPRFRASPITYIDILANSKIRSDSVKRMTHIQNTS